jgi:predicted membrane protein
METKEQVNFHPQRYKSGKYVTALTLVAAGVIMLGHNMGYVSDFVFHTLISWRMLLVVIGVFFLLKRNLIPGLVFLAIGAYFMLPHILGIDGALTRNYWPVFLILFGLLVLFHRHTGRGWHGRRKPDFHHPQAVLSGGVKDGFVTAEVRFGSSKHIVLDPVFRGADIDVSFGTAILDLRSTTLEAPETYVDVDCSFGGVEIYIPSHWNVVMLADNTFSGCEDKRHLSREIAFEHKLVIRGDITFSGLQIKS